MIAYSWHTIVTSFYVTFWQQILCFFYLDPIQIIEDSGFSRNKRCQPKRAYSQTMVKILCHRYREPKRGPNVYCCYDNGIPATWTALSSWSWYWLLLRKIQTIRNLSCNAHVSLSSYMFIYMCNVFKGKAWLLEKCWSTCNIAMLCLYSTIEVYVTDWSWVIPESLYSWYADYF